MATYYNYLDYEKARDKREKKQEAKGFRGFFLALALFFYIIWKDVGLAIYSFIIPIFAGFLWYALDMAIFPLPPKPKLGTKPKPVLPNAVSNITAGSRAQNYPTNNPIDKSSRDSTHRDIFPDPPVSNTLSEPEVSSESSARWYSNEHERIAKVENRSMEMRDIESKLDNLRWQSNPGSWEREEYDRLQQRLNQLRAG